MVYFSTIHKSTHVLCFRMLFSLFSLESIRLWIFLTVSTRFRTFFSFSWILRIFSSTNLSKSTHIFHLRMLFSLFPLESIRLWIFLTVSTRFRTFFSFSWILRIFSSTNLSKSTHIFHLRMPFSLFSLESIRLWIFLTVSTRFRTFFSFSWILRIFSSTNLSKSTHIFHLRMLFSLFPLESIRLWIFLTVSTRFRTFFSFSWILRIFSSTNLSKSTHIFHLRMLFSLFPLESIRLWIFLTVSTRFRTFFSFSWILRIFSSTNLSKSTHIFHLRMLFSLFPLESIRLWIFLTVSTRFRTFFSFSWSFANLFLILLLPFSPFLLKISAPSGTPLLI